jgi:beta-glucosidase
VAVRIPPVIAIAAPPLIRKEAMNPEPPMPEDRRRTQMGYEFRPQAIAATIRRVASLLPGKPLVVTEHGVATDDDAERVEFIDGGLRAIHGELAAGVPVRGYIHWSLMDNFEWARGYAPRFGLIGVDRKTLERTVRPSGRHLGAIARAGRLAV